MDSSNTASDRCCRPGHRLPRLVRRLVLGVVLATALVASTLLLLEAVRVRRMPELQPWHMRVPRQEFTAEQATQVRSLDDYLALEARLFAELESFLLPQDRLAGHSPIIRYVRNGIGDPATFAPNWNRTIDVPPVGEVRGAVLLLHGLTDSPYSMRSIAEEFGAHGFHALCLRLPGHGTVPAGLLKVEVEDWMAAVRLAWRHVQGLARADQPLIICGYSNGGALATLFTLQLVEQPEGGMRSPDLVCLFSPAIGITPFAAASNWHRAFTWIPAFEKSKWLAIEPEFDPFKYNSFAKNAGAQSWRLTRLIEAAALGAVRSGRMARMPPVLTFQSVVDATIVAQDVVTRLYDRLPANGSELVIFDVNHASVLDGFFANPHPPLERLLQDPSRPYAVTVVGSLDPASLEVAARTSGPNSGEIEVADAGLRWPNSVYSLSHVSIPFPEDDPIYGAGQPPRNPPRVRLGELALRGERHVLTISPGELLRLRHNPFHVYMMSRMATAVRRTLEREEVGPRTE